MELPKYYERELRKEGDFVLSSGLKSNIKYDFDIALSIPEIRLPIIKQMNNLILSNIYYNDSIDYYSILGIPTGGERWGSIIANDLHLPYLTIPTIEENFFGEGGALENFGIIM